jgi:hypothetical protein
MEGRHFLTADYADDTDRKELGMKIWWRTLIMPVLINYSLPIQADTFEI